MGIIFSCCKPKKIQYIKVNTQNGNNEKNIIKEEYNYDKDYFKSVLSNVCHLIKTSIGDKKKNARTLGDIYNLNYDPTKEDISVIGDNFIFVEEVMSEDELECILNSYSNSPSSQFCDVDMDGSDNSVPDNLANTEELLTNNHHLQLCTSVSDFPALRLFLENATQLHILSDFIDNEDEDGNTAVSIALLSSNSLALFTLVKTFHAEIPLYIKAQGKQYLFLIYLILHSKNLRMSGEESPQFLLNLFLKEIERRDHDKDYLRRYLKAIDPTFKVSLLHFLVEIYLVGQCHSIHIYNCIEFSINSLPECLTIKCQINKDTDFSIDVIGRILCCANVSNIQRVLEILNYINSTYPESIINWKDVYTSIVKAHNSFEVRNALIPIFE